MLFPVPNGITSTCKNCGVRERGGPPYPECSVPTGHEFVLVLGA